MHNILHNIKHPLQNLVILFLSLYPTLFNIPYTKNVCIYSFFKAVFMVWVTYKRVKTTEITYR